MKDPNKDLKAFITQTSAGSEGRLSEFTALAISRSEGRLRKELGIEINAVRKEFTAEINALRKELTVEISNLRKEFTAEISNLRKEFTLEISNLRKEFTAEIQTLRTEMLGGFAGAAEAFEHLATFRDEDKKYVDHHLAKHSHQITKLQKQAS